MTIDTGGNVGIGTTTPAYDLDVYGNGRFDGNLTVSGTTNLGTIATGLWNGTAIDFSSYTNATAGTGITFTDDAISVTDNYLLNNANDTTTGTITSAGLIVGDGQTVGATTNKWLFDDTNNDVTTTGNVGIGTTGPSYKLEVDGGSAETRLRVSTTGTDAKEAGIILSNSSKTAYNDGLEISQGGGYTRFDDLIGNEIMRLMPQSGTVGNTYFAGNVGIGTMSPGAKLEVNGVLKASQPYWTGTFGVITGTDFIQGLVETASSGITLSGGNTLTVSITGLYLIHGQQLTLGTGSTYFAVEKNDSTLMHAYTSYLSTIDLAIDTITQFNAGDTIKFHYTGSSVSTTWGGVHSSAYVYFLR